MEPLTLLLILLVIAILGYVLVYNLLISRKQKVNEAWSDVDVQLKRRHDLIPSIVNTVKGYAKHEKDLLEKVTKERAQAVKIDANDIQSVGAIEAALGADIGALMMIAEAYPDLKANQNFLKLQEELSETEDQIASSRRIYNSNVTSFNTLISMFPTNLVAKMGGFKESEFFTFKEGKTVPSAKM